MHRCRSVSFRSVWSVSLGLRARPMGLTDCFASDLLKEYRPRVATSLLSTRQEALVYGADVSFSGTDLVPGKTPTEHSEQRCHRTRWRIFDPHGSGYRSRPEGMHCQ